MSHTLVAPLNGTQWLASKANCSYKIKALVPLRILEKDYSVKLVCAQRGVVAMLSCKKAKQKLVFL